MKYCRLFAFGLFCMGMIMLLLNLMTGNPLIGIVGHSMGLVGSLLALWVIVSEARVKKKNSNN